MTRLVLLSLALSVVVAACAPAAPTPPTASPTAPPSAPTAAPTGGPAFPWEPAIVPASKQSSAVLTILPGGDGLVAIGYDGQFGSTVWTSPDGRAWRDATQAGLDSAGLASVVAFDGGLLAVGRGDTFDVDTEQAAAWLSEDGITWRKAAGGSDMRGQMIDVVATDAGFFAVGGVPGDDAAGIWRSSDGQEWERTGGMFEGAFMWSIAEGGPGLVVTGWRRNPEPDLAVWTSRDGVDWSLAPDPEGFEGLEGLDVASYDTKLLMLGGSVFDSGSRIWTSDDGIDWRLADVPEALAKSTLRRLIATPRGLLAVGATGMNGIAWISSDGRSWAPFGDPVPNAFINSASVAGDSILLAGATQEGTAETGIAVHAQVWIAAPATD